MSCVFLCSAILMDFIQLHLFKSLLRALALGGVAAAGQLLHSPHPDPGPRTQEDLLDSSRGGENGAQEEISEIVCYTCSCKSGNEAKRGRGKGKDTFLDKKVQAKGKMEAKGKWKQKEEGAASDDAEEQEAE